jgi:hypothetical protein
MSTLRWRASAAAESHGGHAKPCEIHHTLIVEFADNDPMRKTDTTPAPQQRSRDRVYTSDGEWFVRTREGERGPFRNRQRAEAELRLYLETVCYLEQFGSNVPDDFDPSQVIVVDMDMPAWR